MSSSRDAAPSASVGWTAAPADGDGALVHGLQLARATRPAGAAARSPDHDQPRSADVQCPAVALAITCGLDLLGLDVDDAEPEAAVPAVPGTAAGRRSPCGRIPGSVVHLGVEHRGEQEVVVAFPGRTGVAVAVADVQPHGRHVGGHASIASTARPTSSGTRPGTARRSGARAPASASGWASALSTWRAPGPGRPSWRRPRSDPTRQRERSGEGELDRTRLGRVKGSRRPAQRQRSGLGSGSG